MERRQPRGGEHRALPRLVEMKRLARVMVLRWCRADSGSSRWRRGKKRRAATLPNKIARSGSSMNT